MSLTLLQKLRYPCVIVGMIASNLGLIEYVVNFDLFADCEPENLFDYFQHTKDRYLLLNYQNLNHFLEDKALLIELNSLIL